MTTSFVAKYYTKIREGGDKVSFGFSRGGKVEGGLSATQGGRQNVARYTGIGAEKDF